MNDTAFDAIRRQEDVGFTSSGSSHVSTNGSSASLVTALLPEHAEALRTAVAEAAAAIREANSKAEAGG